MMKNPHGTEEIMTIGLSHIFTGNCLKKKDELALQACCKGRSILRTGVMVALLGLGIALEGEGQSYELNPLPLHTHLLGSP